MTFSERLGLLGLEDSLEAERVFQSLRMDVTGNESAIVDRLEREANGQGRRYLLALLSESKSDIALRTPHSHVHDKDAGARSWARYGFQQITGQRFQVDYRDIEEAEARLVIYPVRWRVYLVWGSLTILIYGLAYTTMIYLRIAFGWASDEALAERILTGWASGTMAGLFWMVFSGERYRTEHRVLVNDETIVGAKRNGKVVQVAPNNVRMTPYEGRNWLRKMVKTWTVQGDESDLIDIPTMLYRASDIDRLKQMLVQ